MYYPMRCRDQLTNRGALPGIRMYAARALFDILGRNFLTRNEASDISYARKLRSDDRVCQRGVFSKQITERINCNQATVVKTLS